MEGKSMNRLLKILLLSFVIVLPSSYGATLPKSEVTVKAGELTGQVVNYSGKGVGDVKVKLYDSSSKLVSDIATNKNGEYTIPDIQGGEYVLMVGNTVNYDLKVFDFHSQGLR